MSNIDDLYMHMANEYTEREGLELRAEMERLEEIPGVSVSEARVGRRVRAGINRKKRRPYYMGAITLLAACFMVAFVYFITSMFGTNLADSDSAGAPSISDTQPSFDVIPLSAPLPQGFAQAGFEQDYRESIYYIEDIYQDDVVLVLERKDIPADTSHLAQIDLGGATAYGMQTDAYCLLTFNIDGINYTLTCKYDINTLIRLGEAFI